MIVLGPFESFSILRRTGILPTQASHEERSHVLGCEQLLPMPHAVMNQDRVFCTAPSVDERIMETIHNLGIYKTTRNTASGSRGKLNAFVGAPNLRRRNNRLHCTVMSKKLPEKSILRIADGVYILCPTLCLIALAKCREISDEDLVYAAYELCSRYAYSRRQGDDLVNIVPLTCTKHISDYLDEISSLNQLAPDKTSRLRALLPFVHDGARSPFEIACGMIMDWYPERGGFAMPPFEMNTHIELSMQESSELGKRYLEADFLWQQQKVIIEYDGSVHDKQREADSARENILRDKGYTVEVLTKRILKNPDSYLKFMRRLEDPLCFCIPVDADARNLQQAFQERVIKIAEHRGALRA